MRPAARIVRFGVFELDAESGELRRHGLKVRLPDQSFQVLRLLLARPGEIVTREELRGALWPADTFVNFDGGLNSAVRKLREALDDSAENPRFIVTLPRRGYRFVAPVSIPPDETTAPRAQAPVARRLFTRGQVPWLGLLLVATLAMAGLDHTAGAPARREIAPEAYAAYLKGVSASGSQKFDGHRRAVAYFEEAIAKQPDYAQAHAALAHAQLQLLFGGPLSPLDVIPKAEAAARRAVALDETIPEPHFTLGQILSLFHWRWEQADEEFDRAEVLRIRTGAKPRSGGVSLVRRGRFAEAIVEAEQTRTQDPLSFAAQMNVGSAYRAAGHHDRAVTEFGRALEMSPGQPRAHFQLGATFVAMGRFDEAIRELEAAIAPGGNARFEAHLGYAYAAAGRTTDAKRVLDKLEDRRRKEYISSFGIALIHDALGNTAEALAALERACDDHAVEFAQMVQYPAFRTISAEPRYQAIMRRVNLPR